MWFLFLKLFLSYTNKLILRCSNSVVLYQHCSACSSFRTHFYLNNEITGNWITCSAIFNVYVEMRYCLQCFLALNMSEVRVKNDHPLSSCWKKALKFRTQCKKGVVWDLVRVVVFIWFWFATFFFFSKVWFLLKNISCLECCLGSFYLSKMERNP